MRSWKHLAAAGLLVSAMVVGCSPDKPHEYGQRRPPVDELSGGDTGLQSKDVVDAADQMARDILSDPRFTADPRRIVVSNMEDKTTDHQASLNFDIFLQALKANLAQKSNGRVTLVANKAEFHNLRSQELEGGDTGTGNFGQGGGTNSAAINPDFDLYGTAMDLPNRATTFYQIEFKIVDLRTRELAFDRVYQVKVAR